MDNIIHEYWPMLFTSVMITIWLIRLESLVKVSEKDIIKTAHAIDELRSKHETKIENVTIMLNEIKISLARIEEKLSHQKMID